jgi:hypothetical protein
VLGGIHAGAALTACRNIKLVLLHNPPVSRLVPQFGAIGIIQDPEAGDIERIICRKPVCPPEMLLGFKRRPENELPRPKWRGF